jgi:hypothetical protein
VVASVEEVVEMVVEEEEWDAEDLVEDLHPPEGLLMAHQVSMGGNYFTTILLHGQLTRFLGGFVMRLLCLDKRFRRGRCFGD